MSFMGYSEAPRQNEDGSPRPSVLEERAAKRKMTVDEYKKVLVEKRKARPAKRRERSAERAKARMAERQAKA